ncbi:MAG: hypothetical protein KDD94_01075 [Calditrichaeota bacterium]|nr:hypothetical protein [Calditrichota bacterium]
MIRHTFFILWRNKTRNFILILQFILSFTALILLMNKSISIYEEYSDPLGYTLNDRLAGGFSNLERPKDITEYNQLYSQLRLALDQIKSEDAIIAAGYCARIPYSGNWDNNNFTVTRMSLEAVEAFGLKFVEGRNFTADDEADKYDFSIINQYAAEEYRKNAKDPFDGFFFLSGDSIDLSLPPSDLMKITGVVESFKPNGRFNWRSHPRSLIHIGRFNNHYTPTEDQIKSLAGDNDSFIVHFRAQDRNKVEKIVYDAFSQHLPGINFNMNFLDERDANTAKFEWMQFGMFLFLCIILFIVIIVGIIGVMSENLSKRLKEIGIRVALGSTEQKIIKQFLVEMGILAGISIVIGSIAIALIMGVEPAVIFFSMLILVCVIFLCTYFPTRKTSRIKPNIALHYE